MTSGCSHSSQFKVVSSETSARINLKNFADTFAVSFTDNKPKREIGEALPIII